MGSNPKIDVETIGVFAEGLDHPEGVCWNPHDSCIYAGGEAGQIYRVSWESRELEQVATTGGFILGVAASPDGSWLAVCDSVNHCVWRLDLKSRALSQWSHGAEGAPFRLPNHLCFAAEGSLYVSDSGGFNEITGTIFRISPEGETTIWAEGPFNFANGVALNAGGNLLYVVCTWAGTVEGIPIREDGTAGSRQIICQLERALPDGLATARNGNLLISCYAPNRIYQMSPGSDISILADDWQGHRLSNPTNLCFAGPGLEHIVTANLGRWHLSIFPYGPNP